MKKRDSYTSISFFNYIITYKFKFDINDRERKIMKQNLRLKLSKLSNYIEIYIAVIILAGIIIASFVMIKDMAFSVINLRHNTDQYLFSDFLGNTLKLVVGIEFVKMLVKHTPESAIEVLMFAIARKLVVESSNSIDIIAGVLAISILFLLRKYFKRNEKKEEIS